MENKQLIDELSEQVLSLLPDFYSCFKIVYKVNMDNVDGAVLHKVILKNFRSVLSDMNGGFMPVVSQICNVLISDMGKYFNFSYKAISKQDLY